MNRFTLQVGRNGSLMQHDANGTYVRFADVASLVAGLHAAMDVINGRPADPDEHSKINQAYRALIEFETGTVPKNVRFEFKPFQPCDRKDPLMVAIELIEGHLQAGKPSAALRIARNAYAAALGQPTDFQIGQVIKDLPYEPRPVEMLKPLYAPPTAADKALLRAIQEVRTTKQPNPVELDPFAHVRVALKNYKNSCLSPRPTVKQMRLEELAIETAEALVNFFKA